MGEKSKFTQSKTRSWTPHSRQYIFTSIPLIVNLWEVHIHSIFLDQTADNHRETQRQAGAEKKENYPMFSITFSFSILSLGYSTKTHQPEWVGCISEPTGNYDLILSTNPGVMSNFQTFSGPIFLSVELKNREREIKHPDIICQELSPQDSQKHCTCRMRVWLPWNSLSWHSLAEWLCLKNCCCETGLEHISELFSQILGTTSA